MRLFSPNRSRSTLLPERRETKPHSEPLEDADSCRQSDCSSVPSLFVRGRVGGRSRRPTEVVDGAVPSGFLAAFLKARRELQWRRTCFGQMPMKKFALERSAVLWPVFVRAPLRGFSCARRQLALLLRLRRPAGYGFPRNLIQRVPPKRFLRTLRKCRASALGSMAHSPEPCPDQRRDKFNKTETLSCTRTK